VVDVSEAKELDAVLEQRAGSGKLAREVASDDLLAGYAFRLRVVVRWVRRDACLASLPSRPLADLPLGWLRGARRLIGGGMVLVPVGRDERCVRGHGGIVTAAE
jgi:hypothetical protein